MITTDVVIIGASAAGLMCAIEAGKRRRKVIVLDHSNKAGKKILMSGGGRCNFTNYNIEYDRYISHNPNFCKSALSRYTQWDFLDLVHKHAIDYHEKTQGQLFCDHSAKDILNMLLNETALVKANIHLNTTINHIKKISADKDGGFTISSSRGEFRCQSLVIATGGLSIPTLGASAFGYKVAKQFGIKVWPTRAGLVPFTLNPQDKETFAPLSGIAIPSVASNHRQSFTDNILMTHRGLSGPAILQLSSYWQEGESIHINLLPQIDLLAQLKQAQLQYPQRTLKSILNEHLPKRAIPALIDTAMIEKKLQSISHREFMHIATLLQAWQLKPNGTEGYRTAEVTLGGVDCDAISSKTMQCNQIPGLYFIGEVLDVSGWLGGYNFQWAWSSGWAAGQAV